MAITDAVKIREILGILRRTAMMDQISRYDRLRLLATADVEERIATAGQIIVEPSTPPPDFGLVVLLSGVFTYQDALLGPGNIIGINPVLHGTPYAAQLSAQTPGAYLWIPRAIVQGMASQSSSFNRGMSYPDRAGEIVAFELHGLSVPLTPLIWLLAREIVTRFDNDKVLLAGPPSSDPPNPLPLPGYPRLYYSEGLPGSSSFSNFDYIFLAGATHSPPDRRVQLMPNAAIVPLSPHPLAPMLLRTMVVLANEPPPATLDALAGIGHDTYSTHTAAAVRVTLDRQVLEVIESNWDPTPNPPSVPSPGDDALEHNLGVWARALTNRRTGIAIAGGGVWSMQAVYILRELAARQIPIDVVVGPSAGAMIGGYYGLRGQRGLNQIVRQGEVGALCAMALSATVSPRCMERYFQTTLGKNTRIENLPTEFYPTSTNLSDGEAAFFTRGSLAKGIAAASSSVPVVAPTVAEKTRYVDGAFSNNVPVAVLDYFDVQLTFAANTLVPAKQPTPLPIPAFARSLLPSCVNQLLGLGPVNRLWAFTAAFNLLGSLSGAVSSTQASTFWNSEVPINNTFFLTTLFFYSREMVEYASTNPELQVAIDEFEAKWQQLND